MARPALTDDEVQAFRARAMHAATKLFAEHGYDGVSMRAIARKLGISTMATYRYFANKAEIFALVRAAATHEFTDSYERVVDAETPPLLRLLHQREAYVQFALSNPEKYRIIFELPSPSGEHPETIVANQRAWDALLNSARLAIEVGLYQGEPLVVAHLMWAHVHGLVSLHLAGKLNAGLSLQQLLAIPPPVDAAAKRKAARTKARPPTPRRPRRT